MRPSMWTDDWPTVDGAFGPTPTFMERYVALRNELWAAIDEYEHLSSNVGSVLDEYLGYISQIKDRIDALR